jgi:hypothetical protein
MRPSESGADWAIAAAGKTPSAKAESAMREIDIEEGSE